MVGWEQGGVGGGGVAAAAAADFSTNLSHCLKIHPVKPNELCLDFFLVC